MAFKAQTAAQTKARDLGLALARLAGKRGDARSDRCRPAEGGQPRLTPQAVGQMVRKERDLVEATLGERGLALVDYSDQGPGRGMEFTIDAAA